MKRLKTLIKYIIWIVALYIFASVLTYIGLNATYKNILTNGKIPEQVAVDIAQATKVNGRIYGEVTSTIHNDLNGKYIKVEIYNRNLELLGRKYLEIKDAEINEPKRFKVNFITEGVRSYKIEIVENTPEVQEDIERTKSLWDSVFTNEETKTLTIILLIFGLTYGI